MLASGPYPERFRGIVTMTHPHALMRRLATLLLVLGAAGCSVKTTVVGTSTTAPQVNHFYVTVNAVWLNTSATAKATDTTWSQVTLKTPITVDLVDPTHSTLPTLISDAKLVAGTYQQMLLQLVQNPAGSTAAAASATTLGLTYNNAVIYTTASGVPTTVPVEFALPQPTLQIATHIVLKGGTSISSASSSGATGTTTGSSSTDSSSSTALATLDVAFDALRHLHFLTQTYGNSTQTYAIYSGGASALDAAHAGAISGTLDVTALPTTALDGSQGIVATAEQQSSDGTRMVPIASALVQISGTSGTFTIYPLPVATSGTTTYDIVIHGPGVQPMVVVAVPVTVGLPAAATPISTSAVTMAGADSTYQVTMQAVTTSATGAVSYSSGNATAPLPAASDLYFYQTLQSPANASPYVMETAGLNPLTRLFSATDSTSPATPTYFLLSSAQVQVASYNAGASLTFASQTPSPCTGCYLAAPSAALRAAPSLTSSVLKVAPSSVAQVLYPTPPTSASGTAGTLNVVLPAGSSGYRYNAGTLLISSAGQVVEAIDLAQALATANGGTLTINVAGLPSGAAGAAYAPAVYDLEARVWNTGRTNPGVSYSWVTGVDMSQGLATTQTLTLP